MRFWDSSGVVPLVVGQSTSAQVERWLAEDGQVAVWTLTPIEVLSALRRLVRDGLVDEAHARAAEDNAVSLLRAAHAVSDVERVKSLAQRLLRVHALRAADALQLGAALAWAEGQPAGRVLHTFDRRLALAAQREGFVAVPPP